MGRLMLDGAVVAATVLAAVCRLAAADEVLWQDDFSGLRSGLIGSVVGARTEYHYLPEAAPRGGWAVSCFASDVHSQRAWRVVRDGDVPTIAQVWTNKKMYRYMHPMVVAGDALWKDYTLSVRFAPMTQDAQRRSGVVFRYRNDRCYYFCGVQGPRAVLIMVRHATAFHTPLEKVLAEKPLLWTPGAYIDAEIHVRGDRLRAALGDVVLEARDETYAGGKIGLAADIPARYQQVVVTATAADRRRYLEERSAARREQKRLQAANPRPVLWKKIDTTGFGVGRNLRFGDLDGDGQIDVLIGQVKHHGPKDRYSELSCLTAMTLDGKILWRIGAADPWRDHLTNDVGFQIHDLDGDGRNEVIYCMNFEIVVADGATGRVKYKAPTPTTRRAGARFERILGDSLYFCDLRGTGHPRDIVIKDRYWQVWALDDRLQPLWHHACTTGHYPFASDIDDDGKDELAVGYSLLDDDGTPLWCLDDKIKDHADGVAIVPFRSGRPPRLICAASDEGMLLLDLKGNILKHHHLGHVQNPAVANLRDDLPGLEMISVNFWRNQGIVHFYDAAGQVYHDCEPAQYGSMCLPVNWTGKSEEFIVYSANVEEGGMLDGWGRRVVVFPNDGHPDMCNAVVDITGDCRDEVVVWDPYELWVYTQDDNPKRGNLYRPVRNSLANYSNYQATVSLPGWSSTGWAEPRN